jgi:hypothetical protein
MEKNVEATLVVVSERLEAQKEKTAAACETLKQAIERAQQLPSEARDKIAGDLDHLRVQLALGKAEGRDAVLAQKEKIAEAVQRAESQIDQIGQQVDQAIDDAVEEWVRAELELRQQFELAASRFESEQAEGRAWSCGSSSSWRPRASRASRRKDVRSSRPRNRRCSTT